VAISSVIKHRGALEPVTDWTRARQAALRVTSEQGTAERCKWTEKRTYAFVFWRVGGYRLIMTASSPIASEH
jgi:hypothetical protein